MAHTSSWVLCFAYRLLNLGDRSLQGYTMGLLMQPCQISFIQRQVINPSSLWYADVVDNASRVSSTSQLGNASRLLVLQVFHKPLVFSCPLWTQRWVLLFKRILCPLQRVVEAPEVDG